MRYCTCETRGCRHMDDLAVCDTCEALVCDLHSIAISGGRRRCRDCAGVPLRAQRAHKPQQLDLFSRVRPRAASPRALDGLVK